ncbi:NAD(P)/FAD-dependent oxidoreductase [Enterococcus durans]|uniref:NAD(P)/FAD-dependent oxidoreductase n=1 Tax=Enterococcus durans TaxID=53345 RepID=UPI000EB813A0|nr:FAD-dependent oxidoreductase [Enterococcus durans]MDB1683741.1 FAD-dependent oxidoreductase [Enterococcus durans]HCB29233.1 FAD-dependent oxidoreductase [Enterococcus sp.]
MEKIAIIGGGIIGMTLANYLDTTKFEIVLYDHGVGQATKASAGVISPWLSKRRNKKWYHLAKDGAAFFPKLVQDFSLGQSIYAQSGTIILRKTEQLAELADLAEERKKEAPEIGKIRLLKPEETSALLPLLKRMPALYISGGGKLDGKTFLNELSKRLTHKGIKQLHEKAHLKRAQDDWVIESESGKQNFDRVILSPGPALKALLAPLGYQTDIRPQKGQLVVFDTASSQSQDWPVAMLDGEADLIPFTDGKILLGATHENTDGWDLTPTEEAYRQLSENAASFLEEPQKLFAQSHHLQVGTRAHTSDFAPFFGPLPDDPGLLVASGLGSSGLTTGPFIGYLLAMYLNTGSWQGADYQKEIHTYIKNNQ